MSQQASGSPNAPAEGHGAERTSLAGAVLRDRRRAWIWWALALIAMALMIAASFGAIEGQESLNESFEDMPESIQVLMGIDAELLLTSPAGYLNSQWFANFLPFLLSIYGIGLGARLIAGEEAAGRLLLLALLHTAITYAVGAWSGSRGLAIAVGSAVTAGGFLLQSLASISEALQPVRWLSPWHWFIDARPIVDGWGPMFLPTIATVALSALAVGLGEWRFQTRDIRST